MGLLDPCEWSVPYRAEPAKCVDAGAGQGARLFIAGAMVRSFLAAECEGDV